MSGILRPSAGEIGRGGPAGGGGVYILFPPKNGAPGDAGAPRAPASQIFSPATRRLDCRQSQTSERSRKYQPLATQPCSRGSVPVVKADCTAHVTAGRMVSR